MLDVGEGRLIWIYRRRGKSEGRKEGMAMTSQY
jgi:hypothetical protein